LRVALVRIVTSKTKPATEQKEVIGYIREDPNTILDNTAKILSEEFKKGGRNEQWQPGFTSSEINTTRFLSS